MSKTEVAAASGTAALELKRKIEDKSLVVGVLGLGYVGLPLALAFAEKSFAVIGFDVDATKVDALKAGRNYIKHLEVAQAISPDLGPLASLDPPASSPAVFPGHVLRSPASLSLVAEKRTLLRLYIGDSKQDAGTVTRRSLTYRISGGGLTAPEEGLAR